MIWDPTCCLYCYSVAENTHKSQMFGTLDNGDTEHKPLAYQKIGKLLETFIRLDYITIYSKDIEYVTEKLTSAFQI